ncbi:MAG: hydratase [Quisquiliibacterium sp.]
MSKKFNPEPAAQLLTDAFRSGALLAELPAECRPQTLDDGYEIQDRFTALLGEDFAGWKLGVGTVNGKKMTGSSRALAARLLGSRIFKDGDTVPMPNAAPVTIEFEIACVLGRDVAPGDRLASPLDAVASAQVDFELVLSRFVDRRTVGWPSFCADLVGFSALVLGQSVPVDAAAFAKVANSAVISVDGKEMARIATGDDAIDPVLGLSELFEHTRERGITLKKGTLVSTGTLTIPFNTSGAAVLVQAHFDGGVLSARTNPPA